MTEEIHSTRWVHNSALDQYHKVECELENNKIEKLALVTQSAFDHLKSMFVNALLLGQINKEYGRLATPIHIETFSRKDLDQAVDLAGGVDKFLKILERSIFTPAIVEKEIPFTDKTIELRVKACVESLIVKAINANAEKTLAKERVALVQESAPGTKAISNLASGIIENSIIERNIDES